MRFNEGIDIKIVYCDDTPSEYIDDVTMNDIYDILDSSSDICKIVDVSGSKKKVVWTDEYGFERAYESKKSARKSLKESYNKKDGDKYKIIGYKGKNETFVIYASKRNGVFDYTMTKDYVLSHFPNEECDTNDIDNLNYFVKYEGLGQLIYGYLYDNGRLEDNVISIEAVRGKKLEVTINIDEQGAKLLKNGWWSEKESTSFFGWNTCDGSFDSYWQIQDDGTAKIYLELDIYSDGKLLKESVKPEIQLMVNNIIDELIGEYSSKEWDALSANEKFDIVRTEYFSFGYKSKYLSEVRDLVIENMNHPFNIVFESKEFAKKPLNEKVSSKYKYIFKHEGDYEIMQFDDYNYEILAIPSDKSLFSNDLLKFKIEKTYIYDQYNDDIWLFVGEVEELGYCFIAFDKLANNENIYAYQYGDNERYAYIPYQSYKLYLEGKKVYQTHNLELKKFTKKSIKESFDDGDQLVIDVVDMLILDFGYDKKTVEKYFYKIHKLNDFDTISIDEYIKIKEEIEKALGYDDIF